MYMIDKKSREESGQDSQAGDNPAAAAAAAAGGIHEKSGVEVYTCMLISRGMLYMHIGTVNVRPQYGHRVLPAPQYRSSTAVYCSALQHAHTRCLWRSLARALGASLPRAQRAGEEHNKN